MRREWWSSEYYTFMKYFQKIYTKQNNTFFQGNWLLGKYNYKSINKSKQLFVEQARDLYLLGLFKFIHLQVLRSWSRLFTCYSVLNNRFILAFPVPTSEIIYLKCDIFPLHCSILLSPQLCLVMEQLNFSLNIARVLALQSHKSSLNSIFILLCQTFILTTKENASIFQIMLMISYSKSS